MQNNILTSHFSDSLRQLYIINSEEIINQPSKETYYNSISIIIISSG